ncbi:hypothetical protein [Aliiglaciecola litoralis]|uniref:Carbohydrate kinase FGGY N-terminal domain-containing protein n=1 Tax=Aliiglaciecola litoralis TaxID=582857 RepID=A0ABN1LIX9_9ALTE
MEKYLVCLDYGSGGIWRVVQADSKNSILTHYPELEIADVKPEWMSNQIYQEYCNNPINLEDSSNKFFQAILSQR